MMPIDQLKRGENLRLLCYKLRICEMMFTSETLLAVTGINAFIIQFPF